MWYTPIVHSSHWLQRTPGSAFHQKNSNLKAPSGNKSGFFETLSPVAPSTGHWLCSPLVWTLDWNKLGARRGSRHVVKSAVTDPIAYFCCTSLCICYFSHLDFGHLRHKFLAQPSVSLHVGLGLTLRLPFNKRPLIWIYSTDEHHDHWILRLDYQ